MEFIALKPSLLKSEDPASKLLLEYIVILDENDLKCDICAKNTTEQSKIEFQAMLRAYIRAPTAELSVEGMKSLTYKNKTKSHMPMEVEERDVVDAKNFVDFVYKDGPNDYIVSWPGGGMTVKAVGFKDVGLWRPDSEVGGKLADMEEGGW